MCKSENTGKEVIKGMAALGREDQERKALMLYFSTSMIQMTSVFLCTNIRQHTFYQEPLYVAAVRNQFLYGLKKPKIQDLIPAFAKEAKFSLIKVKYATCARFS